jgi:hypothetical protein
LVRVSQIWISSGTDKNAAGLNGKNLAYINSYFNRNDVADQHESP